MARDGRKATWDRMFYATPGAWFGSGPDGTTLAHITVETAKLHDALKFLTRQRACRIVKVYPSPRDEDGTHVTLYWPVEASAHDRP